MKANQVEALIMRGLDRIRVGEDAEDQRLEWKREWPSDPHDAARKIAGLCNAALGQPVILVVGVDKTHGAVGCVPEDLANWWPQVTSQFVGEPPILQHYTYTIDKAQIVALVFRSDGAPYLVKVPGGGRVESEVPWRRASGTYTARRNELLLLLEDQVRKPELEFHSGQVFFEGFTKPPEASTPGDELVLVDILLYVIPSRRSDRIVVPRKRVKLCLDSTTEFFSWRNLYNEPELLYLGPLRRGGKIRHRSVRPITGAPLSKTIDSSPTEAVIDGPGLLLIRFCVGRLLVHPANLCTLCGQVSLETIPDRIEMQIPVRLEMSE